MTAAPKLAPARTPDRAGATRLLHVDARASRLEDRSLDDLPSVLAPGDLVVVNDAATLPASVALTSHDAELRLAGWEGDSSFRDVVFRCVVLGGGSWREPTERRQPPPRLRAVLV